MTHDIWAVPLDLTDFNIVVALLGGFISLFGLVSYLLKERYYLSEACKWPARLCWCCS
jgi:sodium/hydrogen antiporter